MHAFTLVRTLTVGDFKNIRRDSLLNWMMVMPLLIAFLVRWLLPKFADVVVSVLPVDVFNMLMVSYFFVLLIPTMFGGLIGFLLLDEKDDDTLTAIQVTPLPLGGYLLYRIATPMVLSVIFTLIYIPIADIMTVPLLPLVPVTVLASLEAPIVALYLASFAKNKVQGFALAKFLSVFLVTPLAAYVFVQLDWQLLVGVLPTYWPLKCFWVLIEGGSYWGYLLVGFVVHFGLLAVFLRRFATVMYRGAT
jgi:fluoroquinolone transport system permease protein